MEQKTSTVNISTSTFVKLIIYTFVVIFLYMIKDIIALIFVALILSSALDPWVDWLQRAKIPRALGIALIYVIMLSIGFTLVYLIIPPISNEVSQIATHFPDYYNKVSFGLQNLEGTANTGVQSQIQSSLMNLSSGISFAVGNIISFVTGLFGGIVSFVLILVIGFYLTIEEDNLKKFIRTVSPSKYQPYVNQMIYRIQRKLGKWLRAQVILSFIIFLLDFIGLSILGVHYALLLALLAGALEIIPFIGPVVALVPAVFFGFIQSPLIGLLVLILFLVVQQLESNFITPKVMSKSVDLNPLVVILVILIGAKIGGISGALIAVPLSAALSVFFSDFLNKKVDNELKLEEDEELS